LGHTQRVKVGGQLSEEVKVTYGVELNRNETAQGDAREGK